MTYGGRWEQLKSEAATHLPIGAGHNRMHTAKAGFAWRTAVLHVFLSDFCKLLSFYNKYERKDLKLFKKSVIIRKSMRKKGAAYHNERI